MNTKNIKPFDLQAALAGKAVMLRDGSKVYVRHHETELDAFVSQKLLGYLAHGEYDSWCEDGAYFASREESHFDIIGMYPETRIINGFEVPAPETTEPDSGAVIYLPVPTNEYLYRNDCWDSHYIDKIRLERGLVFLSKEDAIANTKAMLGINPYEEGEE